MDYDPLRRGFAEFVGAFTLVFIGAGSTLSIIKLLAPALRQGGDIASVYSGFTLVGVALANGLAITIDVLMGGPLTGAAMNPARAFGPELVQRNWANCWVWYAGPFVGGGIAAFLYDWLYLRPLRPFPVGPPETGVIEPRPGETAVS